MGDYQDILVRIAEAVECLVRKADWFAARMEQHAQFWGKRPFKSDLDVIEDPDDDRDAWEVNVIARLVKIERKVFSAAHPFLPGPSGKDEEARLLGQALRECLDNSSPCRVVIREHPSGNYFDAAAELRGDHIVSNEADYPVQALRYLADSLKHLLAEEEKNYKEVPDCDDCKDTGVVLHGECQNTICDCQKEG